MIFPDMQCKQIQDRDIDKVCVWFDDYVHSFWERNPALHENLKLKEVHSRHVRDESLTIAPDLALVDEQANTSRRHTAKGLTST